MVSRFTSLIKHLQDIGMSIGDINEIISLECQCINDIEWINENIAGANAREDEITKTIEYYNDLENDIYNEYI